MLSQHPPHHRISEDHIGRIIADAWAAATNLEMSLEMSDECQHSIEQAALSWPTDKKLAFLKAAAEHWMPPYQDETSWWHGNDQSAMEFIYYHTKIHEHLNNPPRELQELHEFQKKLRTQ